MPMPSLGIPSLPAIPSQAAGIHAPDFASQLLQALGQVPTMLQQSEDAKLTLDEKRKKAAQATLDQLTRMMNANPAAKQDPNMIKRVEELSKILGIPAPLTQTKPEFTDTSLVPNGAQPAPAGAPHQPAPNGHLENPYAVAMQNMPGTVQGPTSISAPTSIGGQTMVDTNMLGSQNFDQLSTDDKIKYLQISAGEPRRAAMSGIVGVPEFFINQPQHMMPSERTLVERDLDAQIMALTDGKALTVDGLQAFLTIHGQQLQALGYQNPMQILQDPRIMNGLIQSAASTMAARNSALHKTDAQTVMELSKAKADLARVKTADELAQWRIKYEGRKLDELDAATQARITHWQNMDTTASNNFQQRQTEFEFKKQQALSGGLRPGDVLSWQRDLAAQKRDDIASANALMANISFISQKGGDVTQLNDQLKAVNKRIEDDNRAIQQANGLVTNATSSWAHRNGIPNTAKVNPTHLKPEDKHPNAPSMPHHNTINGQPVFSENGADWYYKDGTYAGSSQ